VHVSSHAPFCPFAHPRPTANTGHLPHLHSYGGSEYFSHYLEDGDRRGRPDQCPVHAQRENHRQ
jgi:hypothetical protein